MWSVYSSCSLIFHHRLHWIPQLCICLLHACLYCNTLNLHCLWNFPWHLCYSTHLNYIFTTEGCDSLLRHCRCQKVKYQAFSFYFYLLDVDSTNLKQVCWVSRLGNQQKLKSLKCFTVINMIMHNSRKYYFHYLWHLGFFEGLRNDVLLLLLLLLSHISRVWLCVTQSMAVQQASLSLGCSRQEHWSGLPFPSPMHESEKWKWSHSVMSDS